MIGFSNTYWIHKTAIKQQSNMGRWYYGDINGKFWFGTQDSCCIEKYGGVAEQEFEWNGCHCCAEEDCEDDHCDCYDSYEAHKADLDDEEPEIQETESANFSITKAKFEEIAVPWLRENADLQQHMKQMEFETEECHGLTKISWKELETHGVTGELEQKCADYCLLKQIELFFEKNPNETECNYNGEL